MTQNTSCSENVTIQPGEIRPRRPDNGSPIVMDDAVSNPRSTASAGNDVGVSLAWMVDWSVGLELDYDYERLVNNALARLPDKRPHRLCKSPSFME